MSIQEWALIVFTIVMQMAVGSFVILGGVHFFANRKYGIAEADKLSDRALLAIGPVVVAGLIVTLFHLGNPANAPRAVANFGASWLSREIVLALVFGVGGAVFAVMQWRKIATPQVRNALALVVAAVGLVLVYAMASVYRLPTIPAWDSLATPASFFITTFLLGALAMGAAFVLNYWYMRRKGLEEKSPQTSALATTLRWIALLAIVLLGLHFVVIPLYIAWLASQTSPAAAESVAILLNQNGLVFALRLVLVFLGAGVFAAFVYQGATSESRVRVVGNLALAAFVFVLVAEVLGRYLFYASMVRIGI
ncbi:MAG: dimethyl sulfoxide reductase anchor subunit [Anaerolineae bacterium]|nr:dimethyl sulfoxide reductase anchor subunit [Anaerolineae bacterium]